MPDVRTALLVGCSDWNPKFQQLPAQQNLDDLAHVLADRDIGNFQIDRLVNQSSARGSKRIEDFFRDRNPDDLLLVYFSCHGILDQAGQLYFTTPDTDEKLLDTTAISAKLVKKWMDNSRSKRIVLLLDCCYSGAFNGVVTRGAVEQLGGEGRAVITASGKLELAHESEFTDAVVRGLQTGAADRDGDGRVAVYELYQYVHDQVRKRRPKQIPRYWADNMSGELYLANNPQTAEPLPDELDRAWKSETAWARHGAVDGLRRLLAGDNPGGQKRTARTTLEKIRDHDTDPDVRTAAGNALDEFSPQRPDEPPPPPPPLPPSPTSSVRRFVSLTISVTVGIAVGIAAPQAISSFIDNPDTCTPISKQADGVLSFGTLLPETGEFVYMGLAPAAGTRLAYKDINDAKGIPGIGLKFEPDNQHDEGDPSAAPDAVRRTADDLLASGADAIIGPATSPVARNVIDKITCAGVVMVPPSNTAPLFTTYPDHELYFRTAPSSEFEGDVLGKLVAEGKPTVVLISRDDEFGNPLREATGKVIEESGGRVLDSINYDPKRRDYVEEVQRIKGINPDAIVLIGFAETAQILAVMIDMGLGPRNKRIYGSGATMSNTLATRVRREPRLLAGMKGTPLYPGDEAFVKRLSEANPGLPDSTYAAQAYDAMVITALAAAVARTDKPDAIAKKINDVTKVGEKCTGFAECMTLLKNNKDIDYDGHSGPLEFSDPGEPTSATYIISEIQEDGTMKQLRSVTVGR